MSVCDVDVVEIVCDVDVVETAVHHPLCCHSRRRARSNYRSFSRVVMTFASAAAAAAVDILLLSCCRDDSQLVGATRSKCLICRQRVPPRAVVLMYR